VAPLVIEFSRPLPIAACSLVGVTLLQHGRRSHTTDPLIYYTFFQRRRGPIPVAPGVGWCRWVRPRGGLDGDIYEDRRPGDPFVSIGRGTVSCACLLSIDGGSAWIRMSGWFGCPSRMYYEIESRHSLEVGWIVPFVHTVTLNWCVTYGHM